MLSDLPVRACTKDLVHFLPGACALVNSHGVVEVANGSALSVLGLDSVSVGFGVKLDQSRIRAVADADAESSLWDSVKAGREVVASASIVKTGGRTVAATIRSTPVQVIGGAASNLWCIEAKEQPGVLEPSGFLTAILEETPECVKVVSEDGSLLQMNAAGLRMIEAEGMESVRGAPVLSLVREEDRGEWLKVHRRVCAGESVVFRFSIVGLKGTRRHMESHAAPIVLPNGQRAHVAVTRDISSRIESERQKSLLMAELNHRVKNSLTTVQAMAFHTFVKPESTDDLAKFEDRIMALSAAHNVLNRSSWAVAELSEVVDEGLGAMHVDMGRVIIEGPSISVRPQAALALTIYLHELLTNATKYGALSNKTGRVSLVWEFYGGEDGDFVLRWTEFGGPAVGVPERKGFGSELISEGIPRQLKGQTTMSYDPSGFACTLIVPLSSLAVGAYADVSA